MIRLLADENFNNSIVRGVRLREPSTDLVRIQDVGLSGADDPSVLEWAAEHQRVLLSHDVATIKAFAYQRVRAGKSMPGVFELSLTVAQRSAIDDIVLLPPAAKMANGKAKSDICRCGEPGTLTCHYKTRSISSKWRIRFGLRMPRCSKASERG